MSFPRYPNYKDSGVEWLGEVPEHWEVMSLRRCSSSVQTGGTPTSESPSTDFEQGLVWFTPGDFGYTLLLTTSTRKISSKVVTSGEAKVFPPRSVLIVSIGATLGKVGFAQEASSANQQINAVIPNERIDGYFLAYSLLVKTEVMRFLSNASTIGIMNQEKTKDILVAVPSPEEQTQITDFLDRETAKIDELVAEQRRLMKLLKEKRSAVISHAVTKGLNPHAPMKPSGIEWLGDVPGHWTFPKIGYHAEVTKLTGFEYTNHWKTESEGGIVALRGFNIGVRELNLEKTERISWELSGFLARSKLHKGDIVLPCTGTLGAAVVIEENDKYHINQNIAKVSLNGNINPKFAVYWFTSGLFKSVVEHNNMSGMQPVLLIGDIRRIVIPAPPIEEQRAVVEFLDCITARFNELITETQRAITLLQERRTALISATVTGQIDVRQQ